VLRSDGAFGHSWGDRVASLHGAMNDKNLVFPWHFTGIGVAAGHRLLPSTVTLCADHGSERPIQKRKRSG